MPTASEQKQRMKILELLVPALVTFLTGTVPVLITGYFQLKGTKDESESGYKVMVESVKELRKVVSDQALELAELRGQMKGFQGGFGAMSSRPKNPECASDADCKDGHRCNSVGKCVEKTVAVTVMSHPVVVTDPVTVAITEPPPPAPPEQTKKFKPLPDNLSEAFQMVQRRK